MNEPVCIPLATLHLLHDRQLELFGGLQGIRDEGAIESALASPLNALASPLNAWEHGRATDVEALAATYLCALARQQGYLDGNKRSALAAMLVILKLNGRTLSAPAPELYAIVIAAATGEIDAVQVATWIRLHV